MDIRPFIAISLLAMAGHNHSFENRVSAVSSETPDPVTYPLDDDSLPYEEVDGRRVHVMFVGDTPKRLDTLSLSLENYLDVCEFYNILDGEIVYAQSCLESSHFKSSNFINRCNHLGIKRGKNYAEYTDWTECLRDYSKRVANKKREGENHYTFLTRIGYAEDPEYITKVRSIVRYNRRKYGDFWASKETEFNPGASNV